MTTCQAPHRYDTILLLFQRIKVTHSAINVQVVHMNWDIRRESPTKSLGKVRISRSFLPKLTR